MAKLANIFSYMSLTFSFIYSCHLTSAIEESKIKKWEITIIAIMTIYAFYVNFISGYTIRGVDIEGPSHFTIHFGQATPIFFLSLFIYAFLTLFKLIKSIKFSRTKIKQLQSIYTVSGMIVYLISTTVIHLVITFIYDDFSLTWLPPFLAVICLSLVGYASIHHRFYSWRHLTYSGIRTAIILISYIIPIIIFTSKNSTSLNILFVILWCLVYMFHWKKIGKMSAKISSFLVYKELYTPTDKIQTISRYFYNSSQELIREISQTLQLEGELSIISLDNESSDFYKEHLNQSNSALIMDEIEYQLSNKNHEYLKKVHHKMVEHKAAAILPIFDNKKSIFQLLVLPQKSNGFLYSNEEVYAIQHLLRKVSFYLYCEYKIKQSQRTAISIAYEMKNPLRDVQISLSRIEPEINKLDNLSSLLKKITDINKAINYGYQIIDTSLNDINHISTDTDDKEYMHISELIRNSINDYAYERQEDKDRIFLDITDDFIIYTNKTKFTLILFNLLKNAIYYFYSHPQSTIEIKVKSGLTFNKIYFKDYGPGIEENMIDNIFNDFFTYGKHNGTGLGLSYCKRVMKTINGDIHCRSIFGEYTEFLLTFPNTQRLSNIIDYGSDIKKNRHNIIEKSIFDNSSNSVRKIRALVTDDNQTHRGLAKYLLTSLGVLVYEAKDGQQSIEMASHHTFDIIFMDIQMPEVNGFEASIQIRKFSPTPPIIALSGESGDKEVAKISQIMDDRMIKPATLSQFKQILQKWVITN
ncbi:hybrid sensor histidine kinase/response regulator [Vibrio mangrovi]|nr:hybrid sensor histidine kinase/response regulator [Vibrio mangrovi]MDW6003657.1 hybrid sensor histidine kinase/response regulator [Vibrio mangrovi]